MTAKKNLDDISMIRPILIIMLVAFHSFNPWCHGWPRFEGFCDNDTFYWLGKIAYSFMLPMFVFMSSYIWAYQRETLNREFTLRSLFLGKFKRLMIPSILFSLLYFVLLPNPSKQSLIYYAAHLILGEGHLWFLPMLFGCFMIYYLCLKYIKNKLWLTGVVSLLCILFIALPTERPQCFFYLLFFHLGYQTYCHKQKIEEILTTTKLVSVTTLWTLLFVLLTYTEKNVATMADWGGDKHLIHYSFYMVVGMGTFVAYGYSLLYTKKNTLNKHISQFGSYCFGIYIFQEFVLQFVYYHTSMPQIINQGILPFIAFGIAIILSFMLTLLLKMTTIGKKLL